MKSLFNMADPGHAGKIKPLSRSGNASVFPPDKLKEAAGYGDTGVSLLRLLPW